MNDAPQGLLARVEALRSLMPRAEALLEQVAAYIREAEQTALDLGAGDRRLTEERRRLAEEREEVACLRQQLMEARTEFDAGANQQENELEGLRRRLAETVAELKAREEAQEAAGRDVHRQLANARKRVLELESKLGSGQPADPGLDSVLARLRSAEAELARARQERLRMLAILGLVQEAEPDAATVS